MDPKEILNNLSTHLKNAVARAIQEAASMNHFEVTPLHLLHAIALENGCLGAEILQKLKIQKENIEKMILMLPTEKQTQEKPVNILPELNKPARGALEKSMLLAYEYSHKYVGTEHLLFGIIEVNDQDIETLFTNAKVDKEAIEKQMNSVLSSTSKFPEMDDVNAAMEEIQERVENPNSEESPAPPQAKNTPNGHGGKKTVTALDIFTTNLTSSAAQKNIDPVVGRKLEIERLIDILCRRTKNNPVLVGEPGVGKTAIVEGLAKRIAEGNVPDVLKNKKILSLDLTLLVSGTIYRGEFEARLKQTIDELGKTPNVILFIDELHNIIGAGSNQGTMDAANILKPALARGLLRCIGATTLDEYKKYISSDPALERRFQSIHVEEPSRDETIQIIEGIKKNYEDYHHVIIPKETIQLAVDLAVKYIHDNFLPDKAIDLIDEGAASVKVRQKSTPLTKEVLEAQRQKEEWEKEKQEAISNEKFSLAKKLKSKLEKLEKKLATLEQKSKKEKKQKRATVEREDIARIVHRKLHIDEKVLLSNDWAQLQNLEELLKKNIIGQDTVIHKLVSTLKRSYLNSNTRKKPLASFLFVGPSGVGKTALAKSLAENLYHSDQALIKLDMSEFAEQHGVSKLLGSPAGYIGYKERNQFTDKMKRRPFNVLLFDEIDRAHPDVTRLLLQILDEGEMTDSAGKKIYFKNTIIVLTTNVGSEFYKSIGIGFGEKLSQQNSPQTGKKELEQKIMSKLKENFDSSLLSRLSAVIAFEPLTLSTLETIVRSRISVLSDNFQKTHSFTIEPDSLAVETLAKKSYEPEQGARMIEKIVEETLNDLVIELLEHAKSNLSTGRQKKKFLLKEKEGKMILL